MTAEEILYKHLAYGKDTYIANQNSLVLKAMKEYAKQEAEQAWDAAIEWQDAVRNYRGGQVDDKETYLLKYK